MILESPSHPQGPLRIVRVTAASSGRQNGGPGEEEGGGGAGPGPDPWSGCELPAPWRHNYYNQLLTGTLHREVGVLR